MSIIADLDKNKKITDKYSSKKYTCFYAQHDKLDPKEKLDPEYCQRVAEGAFYGLMKNKHYFPVYYYGYMQMMRDYLTGNQDKDYYLNVLKSNEPDTSSIQNSASKDARKKGYEHLDLRIVSSMPNIRSAIHGMFDDYDEYVFVNTIDEQSGQEEIESMNAAFVDAKMEDYTKSIEAQFNIPLQRPSGLPKGITQEELQIYREMGGFKAKWAEGIEQLAFYTQKVSKWDKELKRKLIDDVLCFNFIASRAVFDEENDRVKYEYCDPENLTIQYSTENGFEDAEYAGYFQLVKITDLIRKGFSLDELKSAAINFQGYYDNPTITENYTYNPANIQGDKIMDFRVPVFHYYWIETDVKRSLKVKNKYGEKNFEIEFDKEVPEVSEYRKNQGVTQEERGVRIRRAYQCSWIVGSKKVYDYGLVPNQERYNKKEARIPLRAYKVIPTNRNEIFGSMVERAIPFLNRQQILWLKYQDALAKSHPGGYMINIRLLQNMEIGGKTISPLEAFDMFWKYGRGVYMDTPFDGKYEGGAVLPISQIPGNYGELLSVLSAEMNYIKGEIRENTGVDPTTLGVMSDAGSATEASLSNRGTGNILKPITTAIFSLKQDIADQAIRIITLLIKKNKAVYDAYSRIVGYDVTDVLKVLERSGKEYGMYLEPKPNSEEVQSVISAANAAMSQGRDGMAQIDLGQWMYIQERIMNGGNFKKLRRDIQFMIRKKEERDQQMILQREQVQAQEQAKIAQVSAQMKQQETQMKLQADSSLEDKKAENTMRIDANKQQLEIEQYAYEKQIDEMSGPNNIENEGR